MKITRNRWLIATTVALSACESTAPLPLATVTVPTCVAGNFQSFFAYRNDGGPWTSLSPASVPFTFEATPRFELAFGNFNAVLIRTTVDELSAVVCPGTVAPGPTVYTTTVANWQQQETPFLSAGSGGGDVAYNPISMRPPSTPFDIVALTNGSNNAPRTRVLIARRDLTPTGTSIPPIDFSSAEALPPDTMLLTTTAPSSEEVDSARVTLRTARGTRLAFPGQRITAAAAKLPMLPAVYSRPQDVYELTVEMSKSEATRSVRGAFAVGTQPSLQPGPYPTAPVLISREVPGTDVYGARVVAEGYAPVQSEYAQMARAIVSACGSKTCESVTVIVTAGYRLSERSGSQRNQWRLDVPDLQSVGAFGMLASHPNRSWRLTISTVTLAEHYAPTPPNPGSVFRTASATGIIPR